MKICVLIPSYLGVPDTDMWIRRNEVHKRQLVWLSQFGVPIIIQSQDGPEGRDYHPEVTYIKTGQHCAAASRNLLLDYLYKSDYDYAFMFDDDGAFYPHMDGERIFSLLPKVFHHLEHVDCFSVINPRVLPFRREWEKNADIYVHYLRFRVATYLKGTFIGIKNLWKHKRMKIYFDEDLPAVEDADFPLEVMAHGLGCYMCYNMVLKDLSPQHSVYFEDWETRLAKNDEALAQICVKRAHQGLTRTSSGGLNRRAFKNRFWFKPTEIWVPKTEEYDYREIGLRPQVKQQSLF